MSLQSKIKACTVEICEQLGLKPDESLFSQRISPIPDAVSPEMVVKMIDHTLLKATATPEEVEELCLEAKKYGFASVCVNPVYVELAARSLDGSGVKVCTVIGFPLGANTSTTKAAEAKEAVTSGAAEVDMVINIGALKAGDYRGVYQDILQVAEAVRGLAKLKVIIETCYLTEEEKIKACIIAKKAGADFVKTSTGFGGGGATSKDVSLMREVVGPELGVKASGGIRDYTSAVLMIKSGANRLGTSSGRKIAQGE